MVDLPDPDPELLRGELANLRIINRRFGGIAPVQEAVAALASGVPADGPIEILDLATGSADVPLGAADRLAREGRRVRITAVDRSDLVLDEARWHAAGDREIAFVRGDILELGYPDACFDIVLCSLALHHFSAADAVRIVREMRRLARIGFVVCDLRRSAVALAAAWIYTRVTTRNVMTRTDALASIRAAFTPGELSSILREAGAEGAVVRKTPWFRMTAVAPTGDGARGEGGP